MFSYVLFLTFLFSLSNLSLCFEARDSNCPEGTIQGTVDPNKCYKINAQATDWYSANASCSKLNGVLTSVHSAFENAILLGFIESGAPNADDFWIGGANNNIDHTWSWQDGTPFDYSDWAPGKHS